MNKLILELIIFLAINRLIVKGCSISTNIKTLFPTTTETYKIDLNDIFQGDNMKFTSDDPDFTVVNFANPIDSGNALPIGLTFVANAIFTKSNNEESSGQTSLLGTKNSQFFVYSANFSSQYSPSFKNGTALLTKKKPYKCISLTYLNEHQVIVDCFYNRKGLLVNLWQIIDTVDKSLLAIVVQSSNNQKQRKETIVSSRVIRFWKNMTSGNEYLFRGALSKKGQNSFLEVFLMREGFPEKDPKITLTNADIKDLQIVDYEIAPNGTLWVLNQTNIMTTYNFNEANNVFILLSSIKLVDRVKYLSIDIGIDYKFPNNDAYFILLADTEFNFNVEEWFVIGDVQPKRTGYYTVPGQIKYKGSPSKMDINTKYFLIQTGTSVYFFERGVSKSSPIRYKPFLQSQVLFQTTAIFAQLNKINDALLIITSNIIQVSLLSKPALISQTQIVKSGNFTVTAICRRLFQSNENVTANIKYNIIRADNSSVLKTCTFKLPKRALYPVNTKIDVAQCLSGPLIDIKGLVTSENSTQGESQSSSESQILDTTTSNFTINLFGYPTQGVIYAQNHYDPLTVTLIQLIQTNSEIQGYLCKNGTLYTSSNCILLGAILQPKIVSKSAIMYTNLVQPYALLILHNQNCILNVYELSFNTNNNSGSINVLYATINTTIENYSLSITDFTVVGDRLFVVLSEINQIWVYSIKNQKATRLYTISQQDFKNVNGFYPIGIIGDFSKLGPFIVIDNQMEALIISTVDDQINMKSSINYPLELPGMLTNINLVGKELLITQYKVGNRVQEQISQYSIYDLTKPIKVKSLPFYEFNLKFPLQITSDENFLYVLMTNNVLNVYKPSSSEHETLYKQYYKPYMDSNENMVFTGISAGSYSYILMGNGIQIENFKLYIQPVITFVPGYYNNQYSTQKTYVLNISNPLNTVPLIIQQTISILDSQLVIKIDQKQLQSKHYKYIVTKNGSSVFNINTDQFIKGGVARYTLECPLCQTENISIINHMNQRYLEGYRGVQAMVNHRAKQLTLLQTSSAIYEFGSTQSNVVHQFSSDQTKSINCCVLSLDESKQRLLSICEQRLTPQINIQVLDMTTSPYSLIIDRQMETIKNLTAGVLIGHTIFLLATNSEIDIQHPTILVIKIDPSNNLTSVDQTLSCLYPVNNNVNDFSITAIKTIVSNTGKNQTIYLVLWTCQATAFGVQYSTFIYDEETQLVGVMQPQKTLNITTTQLLLEDTKFLQVQILTKEDLGQSININIIITTNNMMSLIFQINFQISDNQFQKIFAIAESSRYTISIASLHLVVTLPPYGLWTVMSSLSFSNGLLAIPYFNNEVKQAFVALYNLGDLDFSKSFTSPQFMLGGIYQQIYNIGNKLILNIQNNNSSNEYLEAKILVSNPYSLFAGFSQITVQPKIQVVVKNNAPFKNKNVLITAENYYTKQQFNIEIVYSEMNEQSNKYEAGGLEWWGWVLILLVISVVIGGVILVIFRKKNGREVYRPLQIQ